MKLSEMKGAELIKVLVLGPAGSGKTIFGTTFPGPILALDFDKKLHSAYNYWKAKDPKKLEEIDYIDCSQRDDKGTGFQLANNELGKVKAAFAKGEKPYSTILVDSATTLASEMLAWLVNFETGIKRNSSFKSVKIPSLQDYQLFSPTFKNFIYELFNLPVHVVMTGHIKVRQDELTSEIIREANIPGKMGNEAPIYWPEVYISYVKNGKYMAQTQADFRYQARSQIPGLPKEIELSYENLIKKY